jgi:hypothetical protein
VIVRRDFVSASRNIERVVRGFVRGGDGILFEIALDNRSIAAKLDGNDESEVLLAAESAFKVEGVSEFVEKEGRWAVPLVKLTWVGSWADGDIERDPEDLLMPIS